MHEKKQDDLDGLRMILEASSGSKEVEKSTQQKLEEEVYENRLQDRKLRKTFSYSIFALIAVYLFFVILLLYLCGFGLTNIDSVVLITLLGTTTATVIGLFVIVAKYLFHKND